MKLQLLRDIEKPRLSREVAKQLGKAIHEGRFLPGQRLASERQMSGELGVSRPVLREALSTLESQGFVETRHGSGTFVVDVSVQLLNVEPVVWFKANWPHVKAFYDARLIIEPDCSALASQHARPEQLAELRSILNRAEEVIERGEVIASIGLDIDFHSAIADMANNVFLARMLRAIINPDTDLRRVLHRLSGRSSVAHNGHLRILTAIESADPVKAHEEMTNALQGSLQDITRLLKGGDDKVQYPQSLR